MEILAKSIQQQMTGASWIRRMFERGRELKEQYGADQVFDFSLGNPDIPPPAGVHAVMLQLAEEINQPLEAGYCPNAGLPELRKALAAMLSREQQVNLTLNHVVVTCGAAGALTSFFRAVIEPGDEVIAPAPCFVEYGAYCGHFGGVFKPVLSHMPRFQLDVESIANAITPRTRAIIINSPNNPSGAVYTAESLAELSKLLQQVNATRSRPLFLLSDEPYRQLAYDGVVVPPVLNISPYAVVLGSFSKSLSLAGERIGYLAVNPAMPEADELIRAVTMTIRTLGFVNAPVIGQRLVLQLLEEKVDVAQYDERRHIMARVLQDADIKFTMPQGAFYFFPEAPGGDDAAFVKALLQQNILAVPGRGFECAGYFRLTFCVNKEVIQRSAAGFKAARAQFKV